jgi:cobalt-zinc-cadmium efflux system outer membrane protein
MIASTRAGCRLRACAICAALLLAGGAALAQSPSQALGADLASLLAYAREHNPELAAMRQEAQAASQRIVPAGGLPDPVLRVELENVNNYGNDASPSLLPSKVGETKYTLMQQLPWSGKRKLRRDVAEADARVAQARAGAVWAEQAMRLRTAFAQYFLAARSERIARELVDLVSRLEQLAQSRYAGGLAPQQDAIRGQLERTGLRSELIAFAAERRRMQARINALLGREAGAALVEPAGLPAAGPLADPRELVRRARESNPLVQAEAARLQSAQASQALVMRNRYPDFSVGVSPTQVGSRITTWGVMFELNIPLQQESRRAQEAEAAAMMNAAVARAEAAATQAAADLQELLASFEAAGQMQALIANQQLPQAELALQSALAGYETGKVDFASVLDAQRQIRRARMELLKAQVEQQVRLAEIERVTGEAP